MSCHALSPVSFRSLDRRIISMLAATAWARVSLRGLPSDGSTPMLPAKLDSGSSSSSTTAFFLEGATGGLCFDVF
jgi:hypothetical protein